ncbi:MAG: hypothetical protein ABI707_13925 [Ferruginibacter sp.]
MKKASPDSFLYVLFPLQSFCLLLSDTRRYISQPAFLGPGKKSIVDKVVRVMNGAKLTR